MASISFNDWKQQTTYVGKGSYEGTMEEAVLHFFYDGISKMINQLGYKWNTNEPHVASKFVQLCYMIYTTKDHTQKYSLKGPEPKHRNFKEDYDVFDFLLDTFTFNDFLEEWNHCPVVGTAFDYLFKDFCYNWIDVTAGQPAAMTQKILDADDEENSEEEVATTEVLTRRNWSLY
uniref:Uncharacterized protein n=1 Tax=viral metagenome TaxID=1070528 RepID=A0A6C0AN68_9ZZZZ